MNGTTYKRCGCRDPHTGRALGAKCPRLRRRNGAWSSDHGIWHAQIELPPRADGTRRPLRRGGHATQRDAENTLATIHTLLALADPSDPTTLTTIADAIDDAHRAKRAWPTVAEIRRHLHTGIPTDQLPTLADYLDQWIAGRKRLAKTTRRAYASHIRLYYKPHLGTLRIDRIRRAHIVSMFDWIEERNDTIRTARASTDPTVRATVKGQRITGPATMHRIRATLRKALNDAIREGLITTNPAVLLELPSGTPPKPVIWTPERVKRWRHTGQVPSSVMVWTPELTGAFLDHAVGDELYALYHLVATRGLRRGEACGLPWTNVDLDNAAITVDTQIVQVGWDTEFSDPKSAASNRIIPLDTGTVAVLRAHRARQHQDRLAAGRDWQDTGLVFTHADGSPWHPAVVTDRFQALTANAGLPPVRLHDLRHGAATLALAGGADMKTVQELLGHASYTLTANTYTSVLPDYARTAAEKAANLIPRAAPA
ncbi:tyrosine-type recombinase/integrase [Kutzneria sp. 744]|uniref:tyrosine-type recombinase/integrase n=1 Tax=Kutzneria sp. (strain 744) TaxID=345341 RepID=UPI0003EEDEF5|nr:tyrosine-type recombinase/integrase [Kutzneria sp. 744]EWM15304.1 phage integrase [Kutzneria sp. 744]